jgi:hypothetical protein
MVRTHIWKRKEQQRPTTEGIDSPDSRPSKGEVNQRKSPGNKQSFGCASSCVFENGIAVESDDIDCWKNVKTPTVHFQSFTTYFRTFAGQS